jgi:tryptophan synthase alpha subunit
VVGSALVEIVARHGRDPAVVDAVTGRVRALAAAIREARS